MKNLSQLSAKELWSMARAARALRKVYNRKEVNLKGMISGLSNTNEIARAMFAREIGLTVAYSSTTGHSADLDSLDVCEWLLSAITKGRDETLQLLQLLAIDAEKEACRITNLERWHRVRQINVAEACREQGLDFTAEEIAAHTVDDGNLDGKISTVIKRMQATRDAAKAQQQPTAAKALVNVAQAALVAVVMLFAVARPAAAADLITERDHAKHLVAVEIQSSADIKTQADKDRFFQLITDSVHAINVKQLAQGMNCQDIEKMMHAKLDAFKVTPTFDYKLFEYIKADCAVESGKH